LFSTMNPTVITGDLSAKLGQPVKFNVFSTNQQRYEEALAITDQFPKTFRGAVVIVVNDYKDDLVINAHNKNPFPDRLATLSQPSLDKIWLQRGHRQMKTGIFFLDHLEFFSARRVAAVRLRPELHRADLMAQAAMHVEGRVEKARYLIEHGFGRIRRRPMGIL